MKHGHTSTCARLQGHGARVDVEDVGDAVEDVGDADIASDFM
jgi:hypothetical protein